MTYNRRSFLRSGAALTGSVIAVNGGLGQRSVRPEGLLHPGLSVPDGALSTVVEPFGKEYVGYQWTIPQDWIVHRFSWETVGDEDRSHLQEILDVTTYSFEIDGREIPEPDRYRSEMIEAEGGTNEMMWEFPTRPQSVGDHEFSVEITFGSPIRSKETANSVKVWKGTYEHQGVYEVLDPPTFSTGCEWR